MANSNRDTLSTGNARCDRIPSNMSALKGEYTQPRHTMSPSTPPVQISRPLWPTIPFPGRLCPQLPITPNANFAQTASSPSHVQDTRRPNTNRPKYALPPPINLWDCCMCGHTNFPAHSPVLCGDCPHQKCEVCKPTPADLLPSTIRKRGLELDDSLSRHHSWPEAVTEILDSLSSVSCTFHYVFHQLHLLSLFSPSLFSPRPLDFSYTMPQSMPIDFIFMNFVRLFVRLHELFGQRSLY